VFPTKTWLKVFTLVSTFTEGAVEDRPLIELAFSLA
jgi:hypothetical protein